jgi:hypothetical protein
MYFGIGINARAPGIPPVSPQCGDELRNFRKIAALAKKKKGYLFQFDQVSLTT